MTTNNNNEGIVVSNKTKELANYHNNEAIELAMKEKFMAALEHVELAIRYSYSMKTLSNKAKIYFLKKEYDKSIEEYKLALSVGKVNMDSEDDIANVELELSNVYSRKGDIQEARNHYRAYLQLKGFIERIDLNGPTITIINSNNQENINVKDTRLKIQLTEAQLEYATGIWFLKAKNYQEAINSFEKSLTIYSINQINTDKIYLIHYQIANAYMYLNKLDDAREHFFNFVKGRGTKHIHQLNELLDEKTNKLIIDCDVANLMGCWYTKNGQYKEAIDKYLVAYVLYERWVIPFYNVAKQFYLMGKYDSCLRHCKKVFLSAKKNGANKEELGLILALMGDSYAKKGKLKKAIKKYKKSIKQNYDNKNNFNNDNNNELNNQIKTLAYLENKLAGLKLHKKGQYKDAIGQYEKCLKSIDDGIDYDFDIYFNIGRCYAKLNDIKNANEFYNKAIEQNPIKFIEKIRKIMRKRWSFVPFRSNKF